MDVYVQAWIFAFVIGSRGTIIVFTSSTSIDAEQAGCVGLASLATRATWHHTSVINNNLTAFVIIA